jgi:hypothetical protein
VTRRDHGIWNMVSRRRGSGKIATLLYVHLKTGWPSLTAGPVRGKLRFEGRWPSLTAGLGWCRADRHFRKIATLISKQAQRRFSTLKTTCSVSGKIT